MSQPLLSKTSFVHFLECPILLWLEKVRPELLPPDDADVKRAKEQGTLVDDLARGLFAKGAQVEGFNLVGFKNTQKAIAAGAAVLYQPTAVADGLTARADTLTKARGGKWDIHEVKAATHVKPEYISDLAFQRICFERAGIPIGKTFLVHINNTYVRRGDVDVSKLMIEEDITKEVEAMMPEVERQIPGAKKVLSWPKNLDTDHLSTCPNLGKCKYVGHWLNFLEPKKREMVLRGVDPKMAAKLLEKETVDVAGLSSGYLQSISYRTPEEQWPLRIEKSALKAELAKLKYPLHFLDYETFNPAIPAFDGYHPYQQIPFQFYVIVLDAPGAKPRTFDFLMETYEDPAVKVIDALREAIGSKGSVVAWSAVFEKGRNKELAESHPKHAKFLLGINDRIYDPLPLFKAKAKLYVHPGFHGSASLKAVLPVLVPELSYKKLHIQDGSVASASWPILTNPQLPKQKRDQLRKHMIEYCRMDVNGMVKILEHLRKMTV